MGDVDARAMTTQLDTRPTETPPDEQRQRSWLEIVWALVMLQGAFLVLASIESLVVNAVFGFGLLSVLVLTLAGAVITLRTARGLRERKRWARRLTLVAEWFVLAFGTIEVVATLALAGSFAGVVPLVTGVIMPITILVFLRKTKPLFARADEPPTVGVAPTDDPVLGTVV